MNYVLVLGFLIGLTLGWVTGIVLVVGNGYRTVRGLEKHIKR